MYGVEIEVFNRYEHKYIIDKETFKKVINVLDKHMVMHHSIISAKKQQIIHLT